MNDTDVVIVGGGVIGLAIGWRALQAGLSVTLLERDPEAAQHASRVAVGMLAPASTDAARRPPLLDLAIESANLYPDFVADLTAETGYETGFVQCGTLMIARDAEEEPGLAAELALRETHGMAAVSLLPSEARRLEPALAPTLASALEIPDDRAVDPRALAAALARAFARAGGDLRLGTEVTGLNLSHKRVSGVRLSDGVTMSAGHVVIAAGPWSNAVGGLPPEAQIPLRPVKGQILCLRDPEGPGRLQHSIRIGAGWLAPRGDGRYVLGATMEERGFDTTITVGAVSGLLGPAVEQIPAIGDWMIEELMAGLRPATRDGLPVIGASDVIDRLHWATGHHRQGILLAPVTARLVVDALLGRPASTFAAALSPARFAEVAGPVGGHLQAGLPRGLGA